MTDGCMGCRVVGYSHAAYCPEGRVEDLRSRLAEAERRAEYWKAEHLAGNRRIDEAEALLRVMPGYGLSAYDKERWEKARNAFLAADSASGAWDRECVKCGCKWVETKVGPCCPRCEGNTPADQSSDALKELIAESEALGIYDVIEDKTFDKPSNG